MGGIFSSVSDLTRWVSGFAAAFPPGAEEAGGSHPLPRASRREMQLPQVALPPLPPTMPAGPGPGSYGFGLFVEDDVTHGRIVQHSGGYPGFGSHMRWHLASGIGVIVLANGTYAPAHPLAARMLDVLLRRDKASGPAPAPAGQLTVGGPVPAPGGPWPETLTGQRAVIGLIGSWDDAVAEELFSENVAQDEPFAERRHAIEQIRQRIGDFRLDEARPAEFDSPAHCRWWMRGERGAVQAEIRLTPERRPRVQSLVLAVPPAPDSALAQILASLVSLLNDGTGGWPASLPVSATVDTGPADAQAHGGRSLGRSLPAWCVPEREWRDFGGRRAGRQERPGWSWRLPWTRRSTCCRRPISRSASEPAAGRPRRPSANAAAHSLRYMMCRPT